MTSFGKKMYCFFGTFTILTFYLLDILSPIQENITVYKVSSKNFDWILIDQNATGSIKYWVLVGSFSILLCIFVTEWSRTDQENQSDLVFSFGLDY